MNTLKLSVVMAAYNSEKYIDEAIESVLNQTYNSFEFIIINDGSTDKTEEIISSYNDPRIKLVNQENKGAAVARNNGVAIAKGEFIAILDSDDIALPQRFETQLSYLELHKKCILLGSNALIIEKNGAFLYESDLPTASDKIKEKLPKNVFFNSSVIFKRQTFLQLGGYDTKIYNHLEDLLLWIEFSKIGEIANMQEALIKYRLTPDSLTNMTAYNLRLQNELLFKIVNNEQIRHSDIEALEKRNTSSEKKRISLYDLQIANIYLTKKIDKKLALRHIIKSIRNDNLSFQAVKQIIRLIIPIWIVNKFEQYRN